MRGLSVFQGVFYLTAGILPFVSRSAFESITGPKVEFWLVETVGVLVAAIGLVLLVAWYRREISATIVVLAVTSALGLAAIDIYYVAVGRIPAVYLADGVVEIALAAAWLYTLRPYARETSFGRTTK